MNLLLRSKFKLIYRQKITSNDKIWNAKELESCKKVENITLFISVKIF